MCQVTSNPFGDPKAISLDGSDFANGGLQIVSFARPGKLFTAHSGLLIRSVGILTPTAFERVLSAVIDVLKPSTKVES